MAEWIVRTVIGVLLAFFGAFGLPYLKEKWGNEKAQRLEHCIKIAVEAAEQMFGSGTGEAKYEFVLQTLQRQGVPLNEDTKLEIEAAVLELQKK